MSMQEFGVEAINTAETSNKFCIVRMIPAKLSNIFFLGMIGTYAQYTNIFLRDVGLSIAETGFISGMTYTTMAVFSPIWGLLVDYTGRRKLIFFTLFLTMICCVFSLPFVAGMINSTHDVTSPNVTSHNVTISSHHNSFSSKIFIAMLSLEICSKIFLSPLHSMIDAAVMNVIEMKEPGSTYGDQRVYGGLSFGVVAFLTGVAIDHFGSHFVSQGFSKYTTLFCIFLPFALIALAVCLYLLNQMDIQPSSIEAEVKVSTAEVKVSKAKLLLTTFRNFKNIMFLISIFVLGVSNMTLLGYLFVIMKDKMDSSKTIMGLASLVQSLAQIFVFPFADKIINFCGGTINAIEIAAFSYCIRYIAISYIINPWLVLPTQVLHSIGFSLYYAAVVAHTQRIAPKEIYVTMFTIVSGVYIGIGGMVANMLGGAIYGRYGGDVLFRGMGVLCGIWTVVMLISNNGMNHIEQWGRKNKSGKIYPIPS